MGPTGTYGGLDLGKLDGTFLVERSPTGEITSIKPLPNPNIRFEDMLLPACERCGKPARSDRLIGGRMSFACSTRCALALEDARLRGRKSRTR